MDPQQYQWLDVTQQILALPPHMALLELIKDDDVTLEECMHAQEINDEKMDPKFDIAHHNTIAYKLQHQLVRLPASLTPAETAGVCANIFQLEAAALRGHPLSTTVYKFAYLYDPRIVAEDPVMGALTESINTLGKHIYEVVKQSCSIKEDDISISIFSFSNRSKTHDEVVELLLQAEKKVEASMKQSEDKQSHQLTLSCLRVRRFLHLFAKSSQITYDGKSVKKILSDIESARKRLAALEGVDTEVGQQLLEGVFFDDLNKTIRGQFGPRNSPLVPFKESLKQIANTFEQFELYLPMPTNMSELYSRLEELDARPINAWSKSYLKVSLFAKDDYLLSTHRGESMLVEDINDWVHPKESVKSSEKFQQFLKAAAQVISESLFRLMSNSMRWQWENSKIYSDYNYLVSLANEVDTEASAPNRELIVCSWVYYYGLKMLVRQLLVGFSIQLYEAVEIKYVVFVLTNLLEMSNRNAQVHLRKIDKLLSSNFLEGSLNKKMKKKMSDNSKKMFADIFFKRALHLYFGALFKLISVLHNRKHLENQFEEDEEVRIKNRFRIFKNVFFVKYIEYEDYRKSLEQIGLKEQEYLGEALDALKEAKNLFQLLVNQFEPSETYFRQREDAELLAKLSVKASLVAMTLKMGAGNKSYGVNLSGRFPDVVVK